MKFDSARPLTYLITDGTLAPNSEVASNPHVALTLALIESAVEAEISFIQIREKQLTARALYELTLRAVTLTRDANTRLLVNDRADIARAAGADGVHLTSASLSAKVIRQTFGNDFLIGVSTHNLTEASAAREGGADFVTFSPVFETASTMKYKLPPVGLGNLSKAAGELAPFPLLALGGITSLERVQACLGAGARGVAAIKLFNDATTLRELARRIELMKNQRDEQSK